jgi:hypothetical protein
MWAKPDDVATFRGRKPTGAYQGELGNDFHTRIEGTRTKHHMGKAAIRMYDKQSIVLRIETTTTDISFFQHYRKVVHRDGTESHQFAPFKKSIYSLAALRTVWGDANRRYLAFLSAVDDPTNAIKDVERISRPARAHNRSYRGFNLFYGDDLDLFRIITRGEFSISGFRNSELRKHGLIKKVRRCYKYHLTVPGRRITATALKLREMFIIPSLRGLLYED